VPNVKSVISATVVFFLLACPQGRAADIYTCEAKERLLLNEDGLVRAAKKMMESPHFMIDKSTGNAVGEMFYGSPTWQIVQRGQQRIH
jgi:hypothetical protein